VRILVVVLSMLGAAEASGDDRDLPRGELCARDVRHRSAAIDLDVKDAEIHDVFRLLADIGHANLVVSDEVTGKVTLRLSRVAWDAAACVVAATHHLTITMHDNILLVMRAER